MELNDWSHRSGFLEKKSKVMKVWNWRWFVLEDGVLCSYKNETMAKLTGRFEISSFTIVETIPNEGQRKNLLALRDSDWEEDLILNAEDFASLEEWMIAIIQSSRGSFTPSENFSMGDEDTEDVDMNVAINRDQFPSLVVDMDRSLIERRGLLVQHRRRSSHDGDARLLVGM